MKKFFLFFLLSAGLAASAADCIQESPFPFPLEMKTISVLNKTWISSVSGHEHLYFSAAAGKSSLRKINYFFKGPNVDLQGTAVREGKVFCDSNHGDDICFYFYDEGVAVDLNWGQVCQRIYFPANSR